jgi:CRP/FNR family transcriptional regulator, cyclic AMP receptor protein
MITTPVPEHTLRKLQIFAALPSDKFSELADQVKGIRIERLKTLDLESLPGNYIYILVSGVVEVSAYAGGLGAMFLEIVAAGEVFNLTSLLPDKANPIQCRALTDCLIARVPAQTFCDLVLAVPIDKFRMILELSIGRWWTGRPSWYSTATQLAVNGRLSAVLVELSRRFGVKDSRGTIITLALTRHKLGQLIGASRQKISLEIEALARSGKVVKVKGW